jgi:predicted regulator of Ras-like GTPase activity (Roadblock/LC7/MglB family)
VTTLEETMHDLTRLQGVVGGLVISRDGLVLAQDTRRDLPVEAFAALAGAVGGEFVRTVTRLNQGAVSLVVLRSDDQLIAVAPVSCGYLVALAAGGVSLGALQWETKQAAARLDELPTTLIRSASSAAEQRKEP